MSRLLFAVKLDPHDGSCDILGRDWSDVTFGDSTQLLKLQAMLTSGYHQSRARFLRPTWIRDRIHFVYAT